MKKAIIKIFVPDSFKIGECYKCPLSKRRSWEWEEYPYYCSNAECGFGYNKTTCPLEVDEEKTSEVKSYGMEIKEVIFDDEK